jgi:hypothetical protein
MAFLVVSTLSFALLRGSQSSSCVLLVVLGGGARSRLVAGGVLEYTAIHDASVFSSLMSSTRDKSGTSLPTAIHNTAVVSTQKLVQSIYKRHGAEGGKAVVGSHVVEAVDIILTSSNVFVKFIFDDDTQVGHGLLLEGSTSSGDGEEGLGCSGLHSTLGAVDTVMEGFVFDNDVRPLLGDSVEEVVGIQNTAS